LDQYFENGKAQIIGSNQLDKWYTYIADYRENKKTKEINLEILMNNLDKKVMQQFFKGEKTVKEITNLSGIEDLSCGAIIDAYQFEPCGYSMNSLLDNSFSTIHITPEENCSYVSYETNISEDVMLKSGMNYTDLINKVLDIFKPGSISVSLFADFDAVDNLKLDDLKKMKEIEYFVLGLNISTFESKEFTVSRKKQKISNSKID